MSKSSLAPTLDSSLGLQITDAVDVSRKRAFFFQKKGDPGVPVLGGGRPVAREVLLLLHPQVGVGA
jgi:hypothetical protein